MNKIRFKKWSYEGNLVKRSSYAPPSHMNVDFAMRTIAINLGCPTIDNCVNMHLYHDMRMIEWVDDESNLCQLWHRYERAISYIEVEFLETQVRVRTRRSGKEIVRYTEANNVWMHKLMDIIREWVAIGRVYLKPKIGRSWLHCDSVAARLGFGVVKTRICSVA